MKTLIYTFVFLLVIGCSSKNKLNEHFQVQTWDVSENTKLVYVNDDEYMFTVVDEKVFAYQKCGSKLFVKQHPLTMKGAVDTSITNYFIVDLNKSYTDEASKPFHTSIENFNDELSKSCNNGDWIEF